MATGITTGGTKYAFTAFHEDKEPVSVGGRDMVVLHMFGGLNQGCRDSFLVAPRFNDCEIAYRGNGDEAGSILWRFRHMDSCAAKSCAMDSKNSPPDRRVSASVRLPRQAFCRWFSRLLTKPITDTATPQSLEKSPDVAGRMLKFRGWPNTSGLVVGPGLSDCPG